PEKSMSPMRLDGFHPSPLLPRAPRQAAAVEKPAIQPAPVQEAQVRAVPARVVERSAAAGEYNPARQGSPLPASGPAGQALNGYLDMPRRSDPDDHQRSRIDL